MASFLDRFFGFCAKKLRFLGFGVHFPFFSIWFSVFAKNINGFSDLISDAVFGFSSWTDLGFRFLFDLSGNYAPPLISNSTLTQMLSRRMHDKPEIKLK